MSWDQEKVSFVDVKAKGVAYAACRIFIGLGLLIVASSVIPFAGEENWRWHLRTLFPAIGLIFVGGLSLFHLTQHYAQRLFHTHEEIIQAQMEILRRLMIASEYRDGNTRQHTNRVGKYSEEIALAYGMSAGDAKLLGLAAQLHDIGKVGIPDAVLLKPGMLDSMERMMMQEHVNIGGRLLEGGNTKLMQLCAEIVWAHHERWDGKGYPAQVAGEDIPLAGRIVAVADVFDALSSVRPYKDSWSLDDAAEEIVSQAGSHFDPKVVEAFTRALPALKTLAVRLADNAAPDFEALPEPTREEIREILKRAA